MIWNLDHRHVIDTSVDSRVYLHMFMRMSVTYVSITCTYHMCITCHGLFARVNDLSIMCPMSITAHVCVCVP